MAADRPPVPAEQEALDRPWRIWASIAVGAFVLVSLGLGFVLLPETEEPGFNPFAAICRAVGIPGFDGPATTAGVPAAGAPASQVAWTSATRTQIASGNIERGAAIATEVCVACHGENGMAVDPSIPNLAHQSATTLFKQLQDYKVGSRQGGQAETMASFAQPLDEQQMADVAAYYASREPRPVAPASTAVSAEIRQLATIGDPRRGLAACDACHGASQSGPEGAPGLLGQSMSYLEQQLQLFASGERDNDLFARMRTIASQLTPDEMNRLAIYYGGNPAP
jgi:cytochrome c553